MKDYKNIWAWVGVAVVVIIAIVWIVMAAMPKSQPQQQAEGPTPVYAPQGELTPQFPKDLIIDDSAAITGSYSINYSSSTNQYTAQFTSTSTVKALFDSYKTYLTNNGWTITGTLTTQPTYDIIAATNDAGQMEAVISTSDKGQGAQAIVTYMPK
jgi:hypothetical protein